MYVDHKIVDFNKTKKKQPTIEENNIFDHYFFIVEPFLPYMFDKVVKYHNHRENKKM